MEHGDFGVIPPIRTIRAKFMIQPKPSVGAIFDGAEQAEPVRRRVVLKVIKLGMDTAQVIARFQAERQVKGSIGSP